MNRENYFFKATVTRVVDGDTLDALADLGFNVLIKERFRLAGIDTPELRTRDLIEKARGIECKELLESWLADCKNQVFIESRKSGKYGRWLGVIYTPSGQNLNKKMLDLLIERGWT